MRILLSLLAIPVIVIPTLIVDLIISMVWLASTVVSLLFLALRLAFVPVLWLFGRTETQQHHRWIHEESLAENDTFDPPPDPPGMVTKLLTLRFRARDDESSDPYVAWHAQEPLSPESESVAPPHEISSGWVKGVLTAPLRPYREHQAETLERWGNEDPMAGPTVVEKPPGRFAKAVGYAMAPVVVVRIAWDETVDLLTNAWYGGDRWMLARGVPALLATFGMVILLASVFLTPPSVIAMRYERATATALLDQDLPTARLCFERLVRHPECRPEVMFQFAMAFDAAGERTRARAIMDRIAPADVGGHPGAHLWQARKLLTTAPVTQEAILRAEKHLLAVINMVPRSTEANTMLGQLYVATERYDDAERYLQAAAERSPSARLIHARLLARQGQLGDARRETLAAITILQNRRKQMPKNVRIRVDLADAFILLGEFPKALEILHEGRSIVTEETPLRHAIATVYVAWSDELRRNGLEEPNPVNMLERALLEVGDHKVALQRMYALAQSGSTLGYRAASALRIMLNHPTRVTAETFVILAKEAERLGNLSEAQDFLRRALVRSPNDVDANYTLARLLFEGERRQLRDAYHFASRALESRALESDPERKTILILRGKTALELGLYRQAVADLEQCQPTGDPAEASDAEATQSLLEHARRMLEREPPGTSRG